MVNDHAEIRLTGAGKALKNLRKAAKLTLEEAALRMKIDLSTLSRYERNERGISTNEIVLFSQVIAKDVSEVFLACLEAANKGLLRTPSGPLVTRLMDAMKRKK